MPPRTTTPPTDTPTMTEMLGIVDVSEAAMGMGVVQLVAPAAPPVLHPDGQFAHVSESGLLLKVSDLHRAHFRVGGGVVVYAPAAHIHCVGFEGLGT
jgi:hypothetical protein